MRKLILVSSLALAAALTLTACGNDQDNQAQSAAPAVAKITKPTSLTDDRGWAAYLQQLVQNNLQGLSAQQVTPYLVNAGDTDADKASRDRQLQTVQDTVARGVLPGYALAFAGPESAKTADLIVAAFKDAKPGSFNKVIIIFIGDQPDQQRVEDALKTSGATFRFVPMT